MNLLSPITLSSRVSAVKDQISSSLGNEEVILHLQSGTYYGLNEVGSRIWHLIQEQKPISEIYQQLLIEYNIDADQCKRDVLALLQQLADEHLIEIDDATAP
jgi:hypothetical protein